MTETELLQYAREIVDGTRNPKKSEIVTFMTALLADAPPAAPTKPRAEVHSCALGFRIAKTDSGIHIPRDVNRYYTPAEARILIAMIEECL